VLCVAAWRDLDSERQMTCMMIGVGGSTIIQGSIPWSRVKEWCEWQGLAKDEGAIVQSVLRQLDGDRGRRESARIQRLAQAASGK
jgi:hypothetical protein